MGKEIYAIFTAGGSGTRMGASVPKQFLEIQGVPILQTTIANFIRAIPGLKIITVLPANHIDTWKILCDRLSFEYPQTIVKGGITRFHSVKNALDRVPDGVIVMIHDGVRPFISAGLLERMVGKMNECRALIPVLPVTDTLKSLKADENGELQVFGEDPDRSTVFGAQTPQMFRSEDIKDAYRLAYDPSFTDDASVARRKGIPLSFIEGERTNIKITTPYDLKLAEFICGV